MTVTVDKSAELWQSARHEFGPGRVHIVDKREDRKGLTRCGKSIAHIGGQSAKLGTGVTCKSCLSSVAVERENERNAGYWAKQREDYERERAAEAAAHAAAQAEASRRWWANYNAYLRSPEWKARSRKVIERAGGICEGCRENRATQAHHTTYEHVGNEFLWELRAVCEPCHERYHESKKKTEGVR